MRLASQARVAVAFLAQAACAATGSPAAKGELAATSESCAVSVEPLQNTTTRPTAVLEPRILTAVRQTVDNRRDCGAMGLGRFKLAFTVVAVEDVGADRRVRLLLTVFNAEGPKAGEIPTSIVKSGAAGDVAAGDELVTFAATRATQLFLEQFPGQSAGQFRKASEDSVVHDGAMVPGSARSGAK